MPEEQATARADYDAAWKELLDEHLQAILSCFFPGVAAAIDWARPIEFLDQELRAVIPDETVESFRVDRLIKVFRVDGGEQWLLVHLEIQSFGKPVSRSEFTITTTVFTEVGAGSRFPWSSWPTWMRPGGLANTSTRNWVVRRASVL